MISFCAVRLFSDDSLVVMELEDGREKEEAKKKGGELLEICGTPESAKRSCQAYQHMQSTGQIRVLDS